MFSAIIIFPVVAFVLAMRLSKKADKADRIETSVIVAAIAALVAMGLSLIVQAMTPSTSSVAEYDKVKIVALSTSTSTEGAFFLGSGRIEGQPYYFFYFETPDGGKKLSKLNANNVTLYEEDRAGAFMAKVRIKKEWDNHGWVFDFFVPQLFRYGCSRNDEYAIHIPKGSIKEEIHLDLPR